MSLAGFISVLNWFFFCPCGLPPESFGTVGQGTTGQALRSGVRPSCVPRPPESHVWVSLVLMAWFKNPLERWVEAQQGKPRGVEFALAVCRALRNLPSGVSFNIFMVLGFSSCQLGALASGMSCFGSLPTFLSCES